MILSFFHSSPHRPVRGLWQGSCVTATEMPEGKSQACVTAKRRKKQSRSHFCLYVNHLFVSRRSCVLSWNAPAFQGQLTHQRWLECHFCISSSGMSGLALWYLQTCYHEPVIIIWTFHNWNPACMSAAQKYILDNHSCCTAIQKSYIFNVKNKW